MTRSLGQKTDLADFTFVNFKEAAAAAPAKVEKKEEVKTAEKPAKEEALKAETKTAEAPAKAEKEAVKAESKKQLKLLQKQKKLSRVIEESPVTPVSDKE